MSLESTAGGRAQRERALPYLSMPFHNIKLTKLGNGNHQGADSAAWKRERKKEKKLVSGAGDIKITKDGNVLLHEMQIQHPTASLIARASTAQDDMTGDGTTSTVLVIGELLKQADLYITEGLHPRMLTEGFDLARNKALEILDSLKVSIEPTKEILLDVAKTSLRTKVHHIIADKLTKICVDAVLAIRQQDKEIDLHMIELMEMQHRTATDTTLVRGIVTDHGARHPDMPKRVENAYILTCNVSLEYEKSEVNM